MKQISGKLLHAIVTFSIILLHTSCVNAKWIRGNGKVVKEERKIASFSNITAANGIDVFLIQGEKENLIVEADENVIEYIVTEVRKNTLFIKTSKIIRKAKSLKVFVTFKNIQGIDASSGSDISSEGIIKANVLDLEVSSGADLVLSLESKEVICSVSSGADVYLKGVAETFSGKSISGSNLRAKELRTKYCEAHASSGGDVSVHVEKEIVARASSGGDVDYYGNPVKVDIHSSSGGDVTHRE